MKPLRPLLLLCCALLASTGQAQTPFNSGASPIDSTASLPLRNLQIEVRQVERDASTREQLDASVATRVQPGQSSLDIQVRVNLR